MSQRRSKKLKGSERDNTIDAEVEDVIEMESVRQGNRTVYLPSNQVRSVYLKQKPLLSPFFDAPRFNPRNRLDTALNSFDRFLEGCDKGLNVVERLFYILAQPERTRRH